MSGSMADIQCATAEIRRGKKKGKKKEETTGQKYNGLPYLKISKCHTAESLLYRLTLM